MYKMLIAGSRNFTDYRQMDRVLSSITSRRQPGVVIGGGAAGADTLGLAWAREKGFTCEQVNADWTKFGRSAGFKRNQVMVDMLEPSDLVVIFFGPCGPTKGTAHTLGLALARDIEVRVFTQAPR